MCLPVWVTKGRTTSNCVQHPHSSGQHFFRDACLITTLKLGKWRTHLNVELSYSYQVIDNIAIILCQFSIQGNKRFKKAWIDIEEPLSVLFELRYHTGEYLLAYRIIGFCNIRIGHHVHFNHLVVLRHIPLIRLLKFLSWQLLRRWFLITFILNAMLGRWLRIATRIQISFWLEDELLYKAVLDKHLLNNLTFLLMPFLVISTTSIMH